MKKTDNTTYIVHGGIRYRLRRADGAYHCERGCYLPKWFAELGIADAWLERVDPKVELLKAVNGSVRKVERAHKATRGSRMNFR